MYIDESGINKLLVRKRGRSLRGVKIEDIKRGEKFQRTNIVAAKSGDRIVAPHCYNENTTGAVFTEWFGTDFVKPVPKGITVIMGNASFHPKEKLKNPARRHGLRLLFLPPYSPDSNRLRKPGQI
ncbi:MAG: transposase [Syntrophomonadaceae bacterium]|nr:transposase [Syntrophomonadaceae bacterium]